MPCHLHSHPLNAARSNVYRENRHVPANVNVNMTEQALLEVRQRAAKKNWDLSPGPLRIRDQDRLSEGDTNC